MAETLKHSLQTVLTYGGNGLLLLYYAVALIFLLIRERDKENRTMMTTYPILVMILFFVPVFPYVVCNLLGEQETFYRFLWLIPMSAVSAYATILFLEKIKFKWLKAVVGVVAMVCVALGGNPGYQSPVMVSAQNAYQIPQEVVDLCDSMVVPGREVEAVFPHELVPYIRQYTPYIKMPYGYETMVDRWGFSNDLADEMIKDTSSVKKLTTLAREKGCHYIVLNKNHYLDGKLEKYDFEVLYSTENYIVYRDRLNIPKC